MIDGLTVQDTPTGLVLHASPGWSAEKTSAPELSRWIVQLFEPPLPMTGRQRPLRTRPMEISDFQTWGDLLRERDAILTDLDDRRQKRGILPYRNSLVALEWQGTELQTASVDAEALRRLPNTSIVEYLQAGLDSRPEVDPRDARDRRWLQGIDQQIENLWSED